MAAPHPEIRIALLDDHAVVRAGMNAHLRGEPDFRIVGSYSSSRDMLAGLRDNPADILVVDYALGPSEIDGVALIRSLISKFPASRIVVLSSHYEPATVAMVLRVGVRGFVGKHQDVDEVVKAVRAVAAGRIYIDDEMAYRLAESSTARQSQDDADAEGVEDKIIAGAKLSVKEREVIRCFLDGMTVTQIAEKFGRSPKTISSQKSVAYRKLGVGSDVELFKMKQSLEML